MSCLSESNARLLYEVNSTESARHFKTTAWKNPDDTQRLNKLQANIEKQWNDKKCQVDKCTDCDFVFARPFIAGDAEFYNLAFDDGYPSDKWEFQQTLKKIRTMLLGPDFRVFEAGAGVGRFADQVIPLLPNPENIILTEYSEQGIKTLRDKGYTVIQDDIRNIAELPEMQQQFDVVCIFQVMEHMDKLHELMQAVQVLLKPGGAFFAAVPNPDRIQFNEENGGFLDMPPNHVGRFSDKVFQILADKNGFSLRNLQRELEPSESIMSSLYYQRSIHRLQTGESAGNMPELFKKIQFRWIRMKLKSLGNPGEGYWVQMQKK